MLCPLSSKALADLLCFWNNTAGRHFDLLNVVGFGELAEHGATAVIMNHNPCHREVVLLRVFAGTLSPILICAGRLM
jgi:hypothetical protein